MTDETQKKILNILLEEYYPTEDNRMEILMSCTCFPFGNIETWIKQIIEYGEKAGGSMEVAMQMAAKELDEGMTYAHAYDLEGMNGMHI